MKRVGLFIFLQLFFVVGCFSQIKQFVIEHPGAAGLNTYYGDAYLNPNEARVLTNFDIVDGDLVRRPGFIKISNGSDSLCYGIASYYDVDNDGRLLKVSYIGDTGKILFSNPNQFTFAGPAEPESSLTNLYQYLKPPTGYDWVQFENAIFGVCGKSHPVIYTEGKWGTLSMPTPGTPMVSAFNKTKTLSGTYSYKLCYFNGTDTAFAKRSKPGRASVYAFPETEMVILFNFPDRPVVGNYIGPTKPAETHVLILRNKNDTEDYYILDTLSYSAGDSVIFIDSIPDASLGLIVDDTLGSDSIPPPGAPIRGPTDSDTDYNSHIVCGDDDTTVYWAIAYIDTMLDIESPLGPYYKDSSRHDSDCYVGIMANYEGSASEYGAFYDGIVAYSSMCTDTNNWKVQDTIFTLSDSNAYVWLTSYTSAENYNDTIVPPWNLTNLIPYKYMVNSFGRLWAAGDVDFPSRLYYSGRTDTGAIGHWDMAFNYLALDENDGDRIMGLVTVEEGLIAYKGYSTWFITGTDPEYDMRVIKISGDVGTISNNSIAQYNGKDYFMTPDLRVMERTGNQFKEISRKVWDNWNTLSDTFLINIDATVYKGEYWLSFCTEELYSPTTYYNKDIFICDLTTGQYSWRKYQFEARYFISYDTVSSKDYVRQQTLIFADKGSDDIFYFNHNDTCTIDAGSQFGCDYVSAPFLRDGTYKILGGKIEVDMATNDTLLIRLLDIDKNIISAVTFYNHGFQINDVYEFAFTGVVGSGFHFEIYDATAGTATLKVKRIELDYMEYDK